MAKEPVIDGLEILDTLWTEGSYPRNAFGHAVGRITNQLLGGPMQRLQSVGREKRAVRLDLGSVEADFQRPAENCRRQ